MSKLTWLRTGVTWSEIVKDSEGQRPREVFRTYRVMKEAGPDGGEEIEMHSKGKDEDDTSTYTQEDLINEGTLLDMDPERSECIEIACEAFFMEGTEGVIVDTGSRNTYRLIRKVHTECPRCGGTGECNDCGNSGDCGNCGASGECGDCGGTGKCSNCDGEGKCYSCEGLGKCSSCEGKGRYESGGEQCDSCQGTGRCADCNGTGACQNCNGTRRCLACNGTGKCGDCRGSKRCAFCNGALKCRECGGAQRAKVTIQYWYDVATGIALRYVRSVNDRVILERKVTAMSVSVTSRPVPIQPALESEELLQQTTPVYQPVQQPPEIRPPLQVPDICPRCGKSLRSVGTPVYCPFCRVRLLH